MGKYLIRVEGRLSDELTATFPTLDSSRRLQTVIHGTLNDHTSLTEILEHLRGLGVHVVDVHQTSAANSAPTPAEETSPERPAQGSAMSLPAI